MRKHIKGSVATYCEHQNGSMVTYTRHLRVLRNYVNWGESPRHWSDVRASELSASLAWALSQLPVDVLAKQERIENRDE